MTENPMFELADQLRELRVEKDDLAEKTKANNAAIERAERELFERMVLDEIDNFRRSGMLFSRASTTYASPIAGQRDALFDALRAQGHGDIIVETVNANTLSSFVRERLGENEGELPGWLEGKVQTYEKDSIRLRKAGK